MPNPYKHIFDVRFICEECDQVQHIKETIEDMLSSLQECGWPICPECGIDMEYNALED